MLAGTRHPMQCLEKSKSSGFSIRILRRELGTNVPEFLEVEPSYICTRKFGQPWRTQSPRETGTESPASPSPDVAYSLKVLLIFKEQ